MKTHSIHKQTQLREAREDIVTVLFLDIVGFSAATQSCTPAEAFRDLKAMFERIGRLVREHGGTVDRTLGDGLLAYFKGDDETSKEGGHADRALACGVAILESQIDNTFSGLREGLTAVLPLRMGINSGSVYRGDLGDDERPDFTIIGSAVNLGQRLEAACEINRIMIGENTMIFATKFSPTSPGMFYRPIIAKSYQDLVRAYEFDPFAGNPERTDLFISAYRAFAQRNRSEERLACGSAALFMVTSHGHATIINVSHSGVMLRFERYIARGDMIYISQVVASVEHLPVPPMFVEVRWGSPEGGSSYLHGCLFKNLSDEQKADLWDLWSSIIGRDEE